MKRALLILVIMLCTPQEAHAASLSRAPNNLGLIGYWSFNEGTGLKAGDFSGYRNHGTLTGGPTWSGGRFGGGLNFDGVNDYVTIPVTGSYTAKGNLGFASSESFTISLWYKGTDTSGGHVSVGKGLLTLPNGTVYAGLGMFNGYPEFTHYSTGWDHNIRSPINIADNNWHQVTYVNDNDLGWLYVDGVAVVSGATSTIQAGKYFQPSAVAAGYNVQYTSGSFDEVRVYNRALGAGEVARMYAGGGASKIQSAQSEAGTGLVGHWKLDDRAGIRATDSSGRGNNGTLTNFALAGATSNWLSGRLAGGLHFDGTNDHIVLGLPSALDISGDMAISAWIKRSVVASGLQEIVANYQNASTGRYFFEFNRTTDKLGWLNNGGVVAAVSTGVITDTAWHHVVGVRSGSAGNWTITFYIDGVNAGTTTGVTSDPGTYSGTVAIGALGVQGYTWNGSMDDVRIYNRALSAEQVKVLYTSGTSRPTTVNTNSSTLTAGTNLASGLVGHWSFDGKYLSSTTARDTSGQGNDGTLTNGPTVAIGKMGQALSFDGTDDYVDTGDVVALNSASAFTISGWAKQTTLDQQRWMFGKSTASCVATSNCVIMETFNDGNLYVEVRNGGASYGYLDYSQHVTAGSWFHYAVVFDGSQSTNATRLQLYIDGVQRTLSYVGTIPATTGNLSGRNFLIGQSDAGAFGMWNGSMDDVRIYNRALTATEVKQLYYLGK